MTDGERAHISVLVVDDEAANLESLERIFAREGMRTFVAPSAQRAMELCRQHPIDVVLTDLMMPGMDGLSLLKALGTGFGAGVAFTDVVIHRAPGAAPEVQLTGGAAKAADALGVTVWRLSISHAGGLAMASVLALGP